jgi:hypothetical protein
MSKIRIKTTNTLREYTYLGCAVTRNKTAWCYRLCIPDEKGNGQCGRIAPHSLKSYIQIAIEKYNQKYR